MSATSRVRSARSIAVGMVTVQSPTWVSSGHGSHARSPPPADLAIFALDRISDDGRTLVFVTTAIENIAPGWRARETYTFASDTEFTENFELAEPGKDFTPYSETRFRRKAP